jgi:hypothetical protein
VKLGVLFARRTNGKRRFKHKPTHSDTLLKRYQQHGNQDPKGESPLAGYGSTLATA